MPARSESSRAAPCSPINSTPRSPPPKALTDRPFGVNLILMHPALEELIAVCAARRVSHVFLAGGLPKRQAVAQVRDHGAKVVAFAPSLSIAKKFVRSGIDAIVIEGMEAGGHTGPVSTSVLAQEILPHVREVPVFVAGGIGRGEAIAAYLEMGAAGCQMGTGFVCTQESIAHPNFKAAFIRASARGRSAFGAARSGLSGDPGAGAGQRRDATIH